MNNNVIRVPFSPPDIGEIEISEVVSTLRSGWITTGPKTKELERQLATFCNCNKAVCMNSQTAAAEMTLRLLGVGPGDEVIVPAYTYTASCSVILHVGATPVIVDCSPNNYEMDYDRMEAAITDRTKAVIPVDLAGVICDYNRIFSAVKNKSHLFRPQNNIQAAIGRVIVLADSAHALGAQQNGLMCGEIADFSSFSFHAVKNLTTAEGGCVTWKSIQGIDDETLYKHYMMLSLHGQSKDSYTKAQLGSWEYDIVAPYYKCNMTDIMASLGIAQLRHYAEKLDRRHEIIEYYDKELRELPVTVLNHKDRNHRSSGHLYFMRLNGKNSTDRNRFIARMAEAGISCNVHYKPLPMLTAYMRLGFSIRDYPNAFQMYENEATLPLHTCLTDEQVSYVVTKVVEIFKDGI